MKKNLAIFASGSGTNFINIYNNTKANKIKGSISLLVSNNKNCGAVKFAMKNNINIFIYNDNLFPKDSNNLILIKKLVFHGIDLIVLAGYLKKISIKLIKVFNNKIINIHPSLLPKFGGKGFYGINVHKAVFESNEKETGATIHFIDSSYDTGPILLQEKFFIKKEYSIEDIATKVLELEHKIYPRAIKYFCLDKIFWKNNIPFIEEKI